MGWWPFSSPSRSSHPDSPPSSATPPSSSPPPATQPSLLLPPTTSSPPLNRDQQAEADLTAFLASLESPTTSSSPSSASPIPEPKRQHVIDPSNISPSALRPRTMSCRTLFDSAFYCASLGGKFNDIYRFGSLQPCSEHWDAFWFCMRTKSWSEPEKGDAIARYYEEREGRERERRAGGRSSEDVWEMRGERVERAFWKVP
ncbi:Hypothetical protein D9617_1g087520 [Elsinoe fawcettii]|nr:Hypothetical protein D9617_1g087520 [Elsinoe fawcettii]